MNLNNTKLGKLANELNNFINVVNPSVIADLEKMRLSDLEKLASSNSLTGLIAKQYITLLQGFSLVLEECNMEPVNADLDIPEEELFKEEVKEEEKLEKKEIQNKKLKLSDNLESVELKEEELKIEDLLDAELPKHLKQPTE